MAEMAGNDGAGRGNLLRIMLWSVAGLLLLLPLVAMRFTEEVNWTGSDFLFAAILIGGTGALFELAARMSRNSAYRAAAAAALAAAFLTIWVNAAIGMIGNEDNPYNLVFLGIVLLALAGAALARFRAEGMARAMAAAAVAQFAAGAVGLSSDVRGGIFSAAFALLWGLSAALFAKAARDQGKKG